MPNVLRGGERAGDRTYYNVTAVSSFCGDSKEKGTPFVAIVFAHKEDPEWGITAYRYLTAKTVEYVAKDLKILGWDPVAHAYRFEELDTNENSPISGAEATICVEEAEYNGKLSPRVTFINPLGQQGGGAPREQMDASTAKSWGEKVRQALGVGAPAGPAPARPGSATRAKPAPGAPASDRDARVRKAAEDGIANQGGRRPAPAAAPPAGDTQGEDYDFEDIPF